MSRNKIKVLMVVYNLKVANGVSSFVMNYYQKINHDKIKMDFVIYKNLDSPYLDEIENNGGKVYVLPTILNIFAHLKACNNILKNNKYDVVHDNILLISLPLMICAVFNHVPSRILHSHNSKLGKTLFREKRNQLFLPLLRRTANNYVACSKLAGRAMFNNEKYIMIPNVINVQKCHFDLERRSEVRSKMKVDEKCIIGTVARIDEQKNPFFAIDVFSRVAERCPKVEYWWIGSGNLDEKLSTYIKKRGLSNKVKLLGSREDMIDLYHAMDIFFLPSLFEGLGIVTVEAQAFGIPCIISDAIPREVVYTDLIEFVSICEDASVWADSIINKYHMYKKRRSYTYELKQSKFSDETAGEILLDMYENTLMKILRKT